MVCDDYNANSNRNFDEGSNNSMAGPASCSSYNSYKDWLIQSYDWQDGTFAWVVGVGNKFDKFDGGFEADNRLYLFHKVA